jgi:hypothetical protein
MNTTGQVFGSVLVEFQSFTSIDFGIRMLEARAKGIEVYLVLFNEPMHGLLHECVGIVVVAALYLFANALFEFWRQSDVHSGLLPATKLLLSASEQSRARARA